MSLPGKIIFFLYISMVTGSNQPILSGLSEGKGKVPNCPANDEDILTCQRGSLNQEALQDGSDLEFPNGEIFARQGDAIDTGDANFTSYQYKGSSGSFAVLTYSSTEDFILDGEVQTEEGKVYAIDSCTEKSEELDDRSILEEVQPENCGVWIHENEDNFKSNDGPVDNSTLDRINPISPEALAELENMFPEDRMNTVVTVLFYYTRELLSRLRTTTAVRAYINQQVAETNVVLRNSQTSLTIRALCTELTTVPESSGDVGLLPAFERSKGNDFRAVTASADLAAIMTSRALGRTCGIARKINVLYPGSFYGANLLWSGYRCNVYTLAHEFGHLFGGWHDINTLGGRRLARFGYEYGYVNPSTRVCTVMSYCPYGSFNVRPVFSTPAFRYRGQQIGASNADVRRVFLLTKTILSQLGNERTSCCARSSSLVSGCRNVRSDTQCLAWRDKGYCTSRFVSFLRTNCFQTCGYCGFACQDLSSRCGSWRGWCNSNTLGRFTRATCPRTCGLCAR